MEKEINPIGIQEINSKRILLKITKLGENGIKIYASMPGDPKFNIKTYGRKNWIGIWIIKKPQNNKK